jgi:hypothetical protein
MGNFRINDLSRELGIKSRHVLDYLSEIGHPSFLHSSSLEIVLASQIRSHFGKLGRPTTSQARTTPTAPVHDAPQPAQIKQAAQRPPYLESPSRQGLIDQGVIKPAKDSAGRRTILPAPPGSLKRYKAAVPEALTLKEVPRRNHKQVLSKRSATLNPPKFQGLPQEITKTCKFCKGRFTIAQLPEHLRSHLGLPEWPIGTPSLVSEVLPVAGPVQVQKNIQKVPCRVCHALVFPNDMGQHYNDFHSEKTLKLPNIRTARHSFIILPPGEEWQFREVFEHYRKQSDYHSLFGGGLDWSRIDRIVAALNPKLGRVGVESWLGYAVYEFSYTHRVVLECPREGNATYVLWGDWKNMIHLSKGELRSFHPDKHVRLFHTGDWLHKIELALRFDRT